MSPGGDDPRILLVQDVRGYVRLAIDATVGVTGVVESMHANVSPWSRITGASDGRTRGITGIVYRTVRGTTRLVGAALDTVIGSVSPGERGPAAGRRALDERDVAMAVLNGVVGDHLEATGNPLRTTLELRHEGRALGRDLAGSVPSPRRRLLIMIHGLCSCERIWRRSGRDLGTELAGELGASALHVRYNSGLHVSTNGRALATHLEELVGAWPVPVERIEIVAHSMGGLVARSACLHAEESGRAWRRHLRGIAFLGTPHHGAPLERGGNLLQSILGASRYTSALATLGELRSAGITDLRHGSLVDEDWLGRDRFEPGLVPRHVPLPDVACFAIAGELPASTSAPLMGDGLVPLDSALGRHDDPRRCLAFLPEHCHVARGAGHLALLERPDVHERLRTWLPWA